MTTSSGSPFNIDGRFMGRWNIVRSTLGMWDPKGGKTSPCLIYETFDGQGWDEHVEYQSAGMFTSKQSTGKIFGRDTIHGEENPRGFKWRGAGMLSWVTCECQVLDNDEMCKDWAVIHFASTPFTPPGIDIVSRGSHMTGEQLALILSRSALQAPDVQALLLKTPLLVPHHDV